jgi:nucleotidyltransferase/DNA polymerase involved in DNA repair
MKIDGMDGFFVSCERLTNSKLIGLPLIIGGGDRGVVASCSRLGHLVFVLQCLSKWRYAFVQQK